MIRHRAAKGSARESHDSKTCYLRFSERGTWTAVSGTRAYAKVDGGGTYRVLGQGFGCGKDQPPEVFSLTIRARGHAQLLGHILINPPVLEGHRHDERAVR